MSELMELADNLRVQGFEVPPGTNVAQVAKVVVLIARAVSRYPQEAERTEQDAVMVMQAAFMGWLKL